MKYSDLLFTFADLIHAYRKRKGEKLCMIDRNVEVKPVLPFQYKHLYKLSSRVLKHS